MPEPLWESGAPLGRAAQEFPGLSPAGLDLLNGLLTYDPEARLTAAAALRHPYWEERPVPRLPQYLPTFPSGVCVV